MRMKKIKRNEISRIWTRKVTFSLAERIAFYKHFFQELDAENTIVDAQKNYTKLLTNSKKLRLAKILRRIFKHIESGTGFGEAFGDLIPYDEKSILNAAARSGEYTESFNLLANIAEEKSRAGSGPVLFLIYPMVVLGIAVSTWKTYGDSLARMESTLLGGGTSFKGNLALFISFAENAHWLVPTLVTTLGLILTAFFISLPLWTGNIRTKVDQRFPYSIYRQHQSATFLITFAAMRQGNLGEKEALEDIKMHATPWLRERLVKILRLMEGKGLTFGPAINAAGFNFPDIKEAITIQSMKNTENFGTRLMALSRGALASILNKVRLILGIIFFALLAAGLGAQFLITTASSEISSQVKATQNQF